MGPFARRVKLQSLCRLDEIDPDIGKEVSAMVAGERIDIALFRSGDDVRAYLNICPHQGRALNWAPDRFLLGDDGNLVCPHHGACFDISTGECIAGPCKGASLSVFDVEVRHGEVLHSANE